MSRPSQFGNVIHSTTPNGVKYQLLLDSFTSRWARDAAQVTMLALTAASDSEDFLSEAVGFTVFNNEPTLRRTLPLECPLRTGLFCDECVTEDYGDEANRTESYNPLTGAPAWDWEIHRMIFKRPRWKIVSDATLTASFANKEQNRFTTVTLMPRPNNRIVSGYGFEYLPQGADAANPGAWQFIPEERMFVPEHRTDITVMWVGIPFSAVPWASIEELANGVNSLPIRLGQFGRIWQPGELLFKGLAKPLEMFQSATLTDEFDLQYLFTFRRGGWNKYTTADLTTGAALSLPMRRRFPTVLPRPNIPPFPTGDFQRLFVPSADL